MEAEMNLTQLRRQSKIPRLKRVGVLHDPGALLDLQRAEMRARAHMAEALES